MILNKIKQHFTTSSWHLGFVINGLDGVFQDGMLSIQWVNSPYRDRWFADPFILDVTETEIILLVEEVRYANPVGRIVKLTIDRDSMAIVKHDVIIETGNHLSFPNILRENGKVYIYPENAHEGHQDIYEYDCTFSKATFIKTICKDCIWDASITDIFGKRYMFAAKTNDYYLDIYEFLGGETESFFVHKQHIKSRFKNSRMAGQFFKYKDEIYAPFQNCERTYGGNIDLKKVSYNDGQFTFETVKQLFSPHKKYSEGLHTLNEYKGVVVIDVVGYNYAIGKHISKFVKIIRKLCR